MSATVLFCSLKAWATDGWSKAHVGQSCWLLTCTFLKLEAVQENVFLLGSINLSTGSIERIHLPAYLSCQCILLLFVNLTMQLVE